MSDVSSNNENINTSDSESVSGNESISGNDSGSNENENSENENLESTIYIDNLTDYSSYFENLQTIGIFICGLLVAYGIAFAFFKGFKK